MAVLKTSNPNIQYPAKSQTPNLKDILVIWELGIHWSLGLGH
jgi:hypothetical protein